MATEQGVRQRLAAVQMASGPLVSGNQQEIQRLVEQAAEAGAGLVVLPENCLLMGNHERDKLALREDDGGGPLQDFLSRLAAATGVWLVAGTLPMRGGQEDKARQTSLVFDDRGGRVARYDKIHLFDVTVEGEKAYRESDAHEPGEAVVTVATPFGRVGLSICYDLRFPELYRELVARGAEILVVPAAFTARTGEAHWNVLVRARAIENLCYVVASGQGGYHINGRETHGETMIVDPWGRVLDRLCRGSGVVIAEIDLAEMHRLRQSFPVLEHRRL